jgi:hypothetical protein
VSDNALAKELRVNQLSSDVAAWHLALNRRKRVIELLCFAAGDPTNQSPRYWTQDAELWCRIDKAVKGRGLGYLAGRDIFSLREHERPASAELARSLHLPITEHAPLTNVASPAPVRKSTRTQTTAKPKAAAAGSFNPAAGRRSPSVGNKPTTRTSPTPTTAAIHQGTMRSVSASPGSIGVATVLRCGGFHLVRILLVGPAVSAYLLCTHIVFGILLLPFFWIAGEASSLIGEIKASVTVPFATHLWYWTIISLLYFLFAWSHLFQDRFLPEGP